MTDRLTFSRVIAHPTVHCLCRSYPLVSVRTHSTRPVPWLWRGRLPRFSVPPRPLDGGHRARAHCILVAAFERRIVE